MSRGSRGTAADIQRAVDMRGAYGARGCQGHCNSDARFHGLSVWMDVVRAALLARTFSGIRDASR